MRKIGWLILPLALLLLVAPAFALTSTTYIRGADNITVFNGTAGTTTWTCPAGVFNVTYLVVGGGGSGGSWAGGGGGAGGYKSGSLIVSPGTAYTVTVGAGGNSVSTDIIGNAGAQSVFGSITANGGGAGGGGGLAGGNGASGGGGAAGLGSPYTATAGGSATGGGNSGGAGITGADGGGGGGGQRILGVTATAGTGGNGGEGVPNDITGSIVTYSGGGGGAGNLVGGTGGGTGGTGATSATSGTAGTANTGGGGGGLYTAGGGRTSGAGGSGIVVIVNKIPVQSTVGSDVVLVFNGTPGTTQWTAPTNANTVWLTMVGGGGGGGGAITGSSGSGGGGAGGFVNQTIAITPGATYSIIIGEGGLGGNITGRAGFNGTNSSFGTVVAVYGGGGGYVSLGKNGASAGGGSNGYNGGTALTLTPSAQGKNGGNGAGAPNYPGGGGGGALNAGAAASGSAGGAGGTGNVSAITGSSVTYAGGGGGGADAGSAGAGGSGGGGTGGVGATLATSGTNNLGGGGGGADSVTPAYGGNGGSGIVILRYTPLSAPIAQFTSNVTSGAVRLPVQFNDTSFDNPTAWVWNFTYGLGTANTSTMQNPNYTYLNPGTYTAQLTVTNASFYNSTTSTITVTAPTSVPTATFTVNKTLTYLPDGAFAFTDTSTPNVYAWQWNYTTSTNATPYTFDTSQNPTYTFTLPGIYYVTVKATNYLGSTTSASTALVVNGFDAPRPSYIISPTTGTPGALIQFNDTTVVGSSAGLVYNWSFGTGAVEASPFSSVAGSVAHVYNYGGVYDINLTVSNYNGTAFNLTPAGVTISTEQRMTNWYSPHQVRFRVLDANDNVIIGAKVNATAYESSLPGGFSGAQQVLVEMYGINSISAAQMVSSAVQMEGYTGDDGSISLTMHSNLKYLVYVVDSSGNSFTKTLYPQMEQYLIRVTTAGAYTPPQDATNILSTQGNATLTFSEPDIYNCTLGVDYMDITSRTTSLTFTAVLLNNNTVMNTQTTAVTGTQHILLNYTVPNTRGQQWKWYYNATVV